MNLDELQSVQARERQSSDLQHLRPSFYREVGEFVQGLTDERETLVERADDPFSSSEIRQITDDIETAEQTVEAIYERRVGKVVKKASIAAAGMPVDDDGLTTEEQALFEDLVGRIEDNRGAVLSVLDGELPQVGGSVTDAPGSPVDDETAATEDSCAPDGSQSTDAEPEGVRAADLMGGDSDDRDQSGADGPTATERTRSPGSRASQKAQPETTEPDDTPADAPPEIEQPDERSPSESGADDESSPTLSGSGEDGDSPGSSDGTGVPGLPRTTVRITAEVGEVVGADDRDYHLGAEDVVTLPEPNADVLVEKDAAERLE